VDEEGSGLAEFFAWSFGIALAVLWALLVCSVALGLFQLLPFLWRGGDPVVDCWESLTYILRTSSCCVSGPR
jgi:hypothetical protein